jgi:hypothetical protein
MDKILNYPAFVIHVSSICPERKPFFMKNISEAGFTDIRIYEGVVGSDIVSKTNALLKFNNLAFDNEISPGSIGCILSHFTLLKHIIDNNIQCCTIFEDDVWFHKDWKTLSNEYYSETPSDFDILFIGNGLDSCRFTPETTPKITRESCWCTHAYIVTLNGAKKFLNALLNWDYKNFNHASRGKTLVGLYAIDIMIKNMQDDILNQRIPELFKWYCWNGTKYPYKEDFFPIKGNDCRNTGLVMQATDDFKTTVSGNINMEDNNFYDENLQPIDISKYETTEQWIAETYISQDAVVLELGGRYGVVSSKINQRLNVKTNHLVVEPDSEIFNVMSKNLIKKGCGCKVFNGVISKQSQFFQKAGLSSRTRCEPCSSESYLVPNKSLQEIIDEFGLQFDTLVADCEGCLEHFFTENIDYIHKFKMITFEEDYGNECNYDKIKQILKDNNFECIRPGGHSVWIRKQDVPSIKKKRFIWNL